MSLGQFAAGLLLAGLLLPSPSLGQSQEAATSSGWDLSGGDPGRGKQIFASNGCGWCHEGSGRKAGKGPQLMNSKRSDEFLATRILNGAPGRMPAFGGNFQEDQIKDLIAFIHSLDAEGGS